ncbi:MAG TPA: hypothetical protein VH040_14485 [Usitatibacter sp.]|jgi:hypothetical protein|nr:hypothetical protein [Usitatibacter sp.]
MSVTLEELRDEWNDRSRRMDERLRLTAHVLRDDWTQRHRERVRAFRPLGPFAMAVWIATLALLGLFMATHANSPSLFLTALVMDLWVIATGVTGLRQQGALARLDYGRPVVELQAEVENLRIARIRAFNVSFLTGQIVWWIPFAVVLVAELFGVNLYHSAQFRAFAAWNIAFGIAVIPMAMWLARRYGERLAHSSAVRQVADSIAGRDIVAAREYLEKVRRFESDPA